MTQEQIYAGLYAQAERKRDACLQERDPDHIEIHELNGAPPHRDQDIPDSETSNRIVELFEALSLSLRPTEREIADRAVRLGKRVRGVV